MSRKHLAAVATLIVTAALAFAASGTTLAAGTRPGASVDKVAAATEQVGTLNVRFTINRFVRRSHKLYAVGAAVTEFKPTAANPANLPTATAKRAFTARVTGLKRFSAAKTICPVLDLTLGPLDLSLLGLIAHLDKVHLTITADSQGGVLGSLFCSLAGAKVKLSNSVKKLTGVVRKSSLATKGMRLGVPIYQKSSGSSATGARSTNALAPTAICQVLDLTLGPLDLNLLGLMVHLDTVHLVVTADSEGGVLGSLLCSLAGGGTTART